MVSISTKEIECLFPEEENSVDSKRFIYHYTNIEAAKSILDTKSIWLTSFSTTNDLTEGKFIFNRMIEMLEDKKNLALSKRLKTLYDNVYKNSYLASFCYFGNQLSQWRSYGNINIGFDLNQLKYGSRFIEDKINKGLCTSGMTIEQCQYINPAKNSEVNKCIEQIVNYFLQVPEKEFTDMNSIPKIALTLGASLLCKKHKGFIEESEFRMIHYFWGISPFNDTKIKKTYIRFYFEPSTVKRIIIGPSTEQEKYTAEILAFLESNKKEYGHVEIYKSKIPFVERRNY